MYDLLYVENYNEKRAAILKIAAVFPDALIEDASDTVHPARLAVDIEVPDEDWYRFLDRAGLRHCSLHAGLKRAIPQAGETS